MAVSFQLIESKIVWEGFVSRYAPYVLFQTWDWGVVQERLGTTVTRFGMFEHKKLIGIAQIVVVRARRGTFLHVRHGPIFIENKVAYWNAFKGFALDLARKEKAWFTRVSPLLPPSPTLESQFSSLGLRPAPIHAMDAERCWVLDLDRSEDELLANMRKTTRYEVRRAAKFDITIKKSTDPKDIPLFLSLYDETSTRHGFVKHQGILEEFEVYSEQGRTELYLGYCEGRLTAGAIILYCGSQAIYHHGASLPGKAPVSYAIQWEAIREAKKRSLKIYNFWGIAPEDNENHPWRGITLFKKGFGGREVDYIHAHDLPHTVLYAMPLTIELVRKKMRGY